MQITRFIETARWIGHQYSEETKRILLSGNFWSFRLHARDPKAIQDFSSSVIAISQEVAIVRERLVAHPHAPQVLEAFEMKSLLERDFSLEIAKVALIPPTDEPRKEELGNIRQRINKTADRWRVLTTCIEPIETLTVPKGVVDEKPFDETLTIEIDYQENNPQAQTIAKILDNATKLYEAFAIASGHENFPPLTVIYIASGTGFRFDLRGLGEPIKQLKGIFVDAWRLIRHRKADDFQSNGKAIIDGLNILEKIESSRRKNALSTEEANRLKLNINRAMLSLLEAGAMPREIPDIEGVQNRELMQGIQQRLLPPAPAEAEKKGQAKLTKSKGSKRRKKQANDSTEKSSVE